MLTMAPAHGRDLAVGEHPDGDTCTMNELSYANALDMGLEPISYRSDAVECLGEGQFSGCLDALVWSKRQPCLMALLTLDSGVRVQVVGFQQHTRRDLPEYLGFRLLTPGQRVTLVIDRGVRGGLRPLVVAGAAIVANGSSVGQLDTDRPRRT